MILRGEGETNKQVSCFQYYLEKFWLVFCTAAELLGGNYPITFMRLE